MKIIDKYITVSFLKSLLFAVVVFSFIICITYIFDRLSTVFKLGAPISLFILSMGYSFPCWLSLIFPVASLLAVLFSIGDLARNNEITALRTSGLSIWRISLPVIFAGVILSTFFAFFDNTVLVQSNKKYLSVWKYKIKKQSYPQNEGFNIVQIEKDKIFSAKFIDGNKEKITWLILLQLDEKMNLKEKITAREATMTDKGLELTDSTVANFTSDNFTLLEMSHRDTVSLTGFIVKEFPHKIIQFAKKPSEFIRLWRTKKNPDEMSYSEISDLIIRLDKSGIPSHQEQVHKHSKLAKPVAILIMILLGIPFATKVAKTAKVFSFAVSIWTGFLYWGTVSLFLAMGMNRTINPLSAAWLPNILFLFIAGILIYKTEKL
ncbi:MAG: LptF/LptG family permease [Elusimicrobiota bacterium]